MTNKTLTKIEELIAEFKDLLNSDSDFNYDDSKTEFLRWIEETQGTEEIFNILEDLINY
jgi:hypothetical protein